MTLKISEENDGSHRRTAEIIKNGGIAIVPTDTVYSFAIDAFNIKAQKTVYEIKNRSYRRPLTLMTPNIEGIEVLVDISQKALKIAKRFWPGQLTLIFPTTEIGQILSGGRKNLGVRIPDSEFMMNLLKEIGGPIFTTSVNVSNKQSAKNVNETLNFDGIADVIVDGGQCKFSFESTVIDTVQFPYVIIRRGCLDANELLKYI